MDITRDQAQASLDTIQQVMKNTRRAISHAGGGYYLIIWGVIWAIGFLGSQFFERSVSGILWFALDTLGGIGMYVVSSKYGGRVRSLPTQRVGWFWMTLILYVVVWVLITAPEDINQMLMVIITACMFGYVVMGLWLQANALIWIGLGVTALALFGFYLLPAYFGLWMALIGGGSLSGGGMYILKRWK